MMPRLEYSGASLISEKELKMPIPELEPHCGSWVVTRRDTGEVIGEFFHRPNVEKCNPDRVTIETALQYLVRINRGIKNGIV